jgi:PTH1 family peptidyl-tRNA hydrolase
MHLVLGLGNPGTKYANTRHNAGFLVVDRLAQRAGVPVDQRQLGAEVGRATVGGAPAVLAKPQSYMNLSGQPAVSLRGYYKVPEEQVVVVHDDLDIPFGDVRVKKGGGHGGHNGLRDLHAKLGSGEFVRVRFGVSRPPPETNTADYVLAPWSAEESERLVDLVDRAADAVESVVRDGVVQAMNQFNTRPRPPGQGSQAPKAP